MGGVLAGIARHGRPRGPVELLDVVAVTPEGGIAGDYRGGMRGRPYKRQVTVMQRDAWNAACREIGYAMPWQERRVNLLAEGIALPRRAGVLLRIGADVVLEITRECDPCTRMEAVAPGLKAALLRDWRGGVCTMVRRGGRIAAGDRIRIEETWTSPSEHWTTSPMTCAASASSSGPT